MTIFQAHVQTQSVALRSIDVKKRFYVFIILVTFFYVLNVFLIFWTFFILKNVGKVQSGKQTNRKHFQNNSNETMNKM